MVKLAGPHQCARCSGCVHTLKTSSRGASSVRSMCNTRLAGSVMRSFTAISAVLLGLKLAQVFFQPVEPFLPESPVLIDPVVRVPKRFCLQPARTPLRVPSPLNQPCPLQHFQVLGNRWL